MVYLIGAGPGDPGLITYKGLQILKSCDAVIYDRLGTGELLDLVRPDCAKIYVGKQAGAHYKKQEEINRILVETAGKYENVVRLKGGDSFVFGRGGEEILTYSVSGDSGCDFCDCGAGGAWNSCDASGDEPEFPCDYRTYEEGRGRCTCEYS